MFFRDSLGMELLRKEPLEGMELPLEHMVLPSLAWHHLLASLINLVRC